MRTHSGVYERSLFGGRIFIYAFTLCTGDVWLKTTGTKSEVTCKRCLKKLALPRT